jgi:hypothetical protein
MQQIKKLTLVYLGVLVSLEFQKFFKGLGSVSKNVSKKVSYHVLIVR